MNIKFKIFEIIAILSCCGIIGWIITDFYGGMTLFLFSYGIIIFPIIILYIISLLNTIISFFRNGIKETKIRIISHSIVLIAIIALNLYSSEIFKSKKILNATLIDDQFVYNLKFRENGKCENEINGIFGFQQNFDGEYIMKNDTIIFTKKPYDNDFIPDTLLIDRKLKGIFMEKDKNGNFMKDKSFGGYFEIK
ncbi:MAG: hypothetical protein O9267_13840 [Flavobacterium sp.]|uniref:hypothetical protein n=1 Tax=Flavobacterium sp. TaxID=239 RepID=UPI0022BAC8C1|nr:hypothetical protein [Flavobacterium sp.]MCZ8198681.1 hypothetical protein [Flavobacterium sp.]